MVTKIWWIFWFSLHTLGDLRDQNPSHENQLYWSTGLALHLFPASASGLYFLTLNKQLMCWILTDLALLLLILFSFLTAIIFYLIPTYQQLFFFLFWTFWALITRHINDCTSVKYNQKVDKLTLFSDSRKRSSLFDLTTVIFKSPWKISQNIISSIIKLSNDCMRYSGVIITIPLHDWRCDQTVAGWLVLMVTWRRVCAWSGAATTALSFFLLGVHIFHVFCP